MLQIIQIARLVLSLLPLILDTVRAIEAALPEGGQGKAKLAMIRETLAGVFETVGDATTTFEQVWPALERTVGAVVGLFNTVGAFKK